MANIEEQKWGGYSEKSNDERTDEELYAVIQPTSTAPIKSPLLSELSRIGGDGQDLRDSLVGFKDGVPGIFSGYAAEKVRTSIKKNQPFYGHDDGHAILNLSDAQDDNIAMPNTTESAVRPLGGPSGGPPGPPPGGPPGGPPGAAASTITGDEGTDEGTDEEDSSVDLSTMNFDPRKSIANKQVIIETGIGNAHVETGMRFYNPVTETTYQHTSSFLVNLSGNEEGHESTSSCASDLEQSIEQSVVAAPSVAEIYEAIGSPRTSLNKKIESDYTNIDYGKVKKTIEKLPRLPPRNSIIHYSEEDKKTYFEVELNEQRKPVQLPPLRQPSAEYQIKRYQLIKCIMENEYAYMTSLRRLVKEYEEPLLEGEIINQEGAKSMFKDVHEIMQCHQLFTMALGYRANEWDKKEVIGDVILASFSKSMVFKAYCNFVCRFSITMDSIKETCKSVPAFLNFLKNKEHGGEARHGRESLYHLMCKPLEYIPNIVLLTETLLDETPFPHEDRLPLQMALTHLECLCEHLRNERTDIIMKEKVKYLDSQCIGLDKELASSVRYFIRHDDMLLCESENGKLVKTKACKIFMLNDVVLCVSSMSKRQQMQLMTNKVYKVKWCFPISDVHIVDATSGIYINTEAKKGSGENSYQIFSGQYPSEYVEDLLHDLTMVGDIMGKVSSLRLSYSFIDSNKVNEWYKEIHKRLDNVMEMANMNWIEMSIPCGNKEKRKQLLFNVPSPKTKLEWSTDFENINLLLTGDNNPGWYMPEESIYEHEVVNLRRALPLVSCIQPLFMVNPETSVQCVLDATALSSSKPILWIFSGNERLGVITLLEMNMSSYPHVLHSYVACNERITCAEIVMKCCDAQSEASAFVWIGTMSGRVMIYNALNINERQPQMSTTLDDSIVSMKFTSNGVFIGLANGSLLRFNIETGTKWNISNPTIVSLSLFPIVSITESCEKLWCAAGSQIYIVEKDTMLTEEKISTCDDRKGTIRQLISYGIGVWVSLRKSTILLLYHGETKKQLQMINTVTSITRMKNDIDGPMRDICIENIYVTTILANEGLLWVGVDQGFIVTYPLPKLGGIPTVSGKACVSFHAHGDNAKHIHAFRVHSVKSTDVCKGGTTEKIPDELYTVPEYFTLEPESEPENETNSISETDVKFEQRDFSLRNENGEQVGDEVGKILKINDEFGHNNQPCTGSSGKAVKNNKNNKNKCYPGTKCDIKNADINMNKAECDDDDDVSPFEDFCFIENEMCDFSKNDSTCSSLQPSLDNLSTKMSFFEKDGFANTMENFVGFNEVSNVNKDAIGQSSNVASSSEIREDNIPVTSSAVPSQVGVSQTICITEKENDDHDNCEVIVTDEKSESKDTLTGPCKSDVPRKVEIPLTFPTPRRRRIQNRAKDVEKPTCKVPTEEVMGDTRKVPTEEVTADTHKVPTEEVTGDTRKVPTEEVTADTRKVPIEEVPADTRKVPIEEVPADTHKVPTEEVPADTRKVPTEEVTANTRKVPTEEVMADTCKVPTEEVMENSNIIEEQGKTDSPAKVEIPCNRKQNGVKGVNIPECADDTVPTSTYESFTSNTQFENKEDLPASFFVQGESFSAYDTRPRNESGNDVSLECPETTHTASEDSSEDHVYEVPLKICNDFYETLENIKDKDIMLKKGINSNNPVRSKRKEYRTKSLPLPNSSNSSNMWSQKSSNSSYFPPLLQKRKRSNKFPELTFTKKESRNDLEKKSWYVVSIGRGHVDLRKVSKCNEEDLNLLNSSSFQGREPMLILWKLNAGNSIFFME